MKKKLLSILALLCLTVSSAWAGTQATGYFESCTAYHGSIRVKGWAYDPDQPATSIQVHAYIWYGPSVGTTQEERMPAVGINANIERSDVNEAKGITGAHGFDQYIAVPAGTYTVQVFAIDKTGDGNPKIPGTSGNPATYTVTVTDPYNITYDANGGSGAPDAQQKSEKININLSAAKPTRDGYVFKEWNTAQDGSGISYAPGAAYTADGDATLYAQWLEIVASGDCGTGVTYSLTEDGKLTISGTGAMTKFDLFMTKAPWDGYKASITSVVIESGVTSIGEYAFNECTSLASVTIPTGVTSIGRSAFEQCSNLTTIDIPTSVESIGNCAFGCTGLTEIDIPASVTSIGQGTFSSCSNLKSANLPDNLTSIPSQLFYQCTSLEAITIPASVTKIESSAFYGCNNASLTTISIPAGVTSIGSEAFRNCTGLISIDLPANLTTIDSYAFMGCNNASLTTISIPASVTSIGQNAFKNCSKLATVTIYATSLTTYGPGAFDDTASGLKIYVPYGSGDTYKAGWADYESKIEEMLAPGAYKVSVKEGTEDAANWQGKAGEGKYQQLPLGVFAGTAVSLKYGGALKVKSVKAKKAAKPAATVTTAPTAKTGVKAGEDVAIVNEGAAEGGTMMYMVNATQPASTDGFSATVPTAEGLTAGTYYVWYYVKADDSHTDSEISATGIEVTIASAYTMAAAATSADKGKLICTDGHIHAYGADAACTKARVAKIIYIGTTGHATYSHGLALALTDEASTMAWQDAIDACSAKNTSTPVTGATWLQASYYQWNYMLGTNGAGSYDALRTGFTSVGGTDLQSDGYWSSTQSSDRQAYYFNFNKSDYYTTLKTSAKWVRACLAF